mgnify:CR=1 FL=1
MARIPWQFYDPVAEETYNWEINPSEGGFPDRVKNISFQTSAGPNGQTIAFEGRRNPMSFQFSGTILSQSQFDTLNDWFEKSNQIQLTDDLGRSFWIYIKSFSPRRVRSGRFQWKHTYTIEAILLDWA